jgi:hypothetical protein
MDLGDDATYPMRGFVSISFHMLSGDVLASTDILFFPSLKKNVLAGSCMKDVQWRVSFEG